MVAATVELDDHAGPRVGEVHPSDPGAVADVELAHGLWKPGMPDQPQEPSLQLAGRGHEAVGPVIEEAPHQGDAGPSPGGHLVGDAA